jgi:Tol biopolymer transport system component
VASLVGSQFSTKRSVVNAPQPVHARIGLDPAGHLLTGGRPIMPPFALSPDGRTVVFAASTDGDTTRLFVRDLDRPESVALRGTEGARWPFFAPDGGRVAFVEGATSAANIRSVPIAGGLPTTHVEDVWPFGVSWGADGYLYYTRDYRSAIWRVAAAGGEPEQVTNVGPGNYSHRHPHLVPGTDTLLYVSTDGPQPCRWESARIVAHSLQSGDTWTVLEGGANPRVLPTGHLIFNDGTMLMAVPFDTAAGRIRGSAAPVLDGLLTSQCGPVPFVEYGMAMVDVANNGTLIYLAGGLLPARRLELVAEVPGGERQLISSAKVGLSPRVAPDGKRVLVGTPAGLLLIDPDRGQSDLTIDDGYFGTFSPDGASVAFMDGNTVSRRASDGTGETEVVLETTSETYAGAWSSDDTLLLVRSEGEVARDGWGIWALDLKAVPGAAPRRLFGDEGSQSFPALSPDERWLAYTEGVDNTRVFITSYPDLTGRYLVGAGRAPVWSSDGRTLYVETAGDRGLAAGLDAVDVTDPRAPGVAANFHALSQYAGSAPVRGYDIFPDGRVVFSRLPDELLQQASEAGSATHIELILDWFQELERVVPGSR